MSNIYELTQDYLQIMTMMEDPELDLRTLKDTLEAVEGAFEIKAENYAKVMKNLEGDLTAIKSEVDRLTGKKRVIENNIKRLKTALQDAMEVSGKTKFKTELFSFGIQKNAPSVVIDTKDIDSIPEEFLKFRDPEVDKTAIKNAMINRGVTELEGIAHLEQGQSLRIR